MRERSWKLLGNSMAVLLFWTICLAGQLTVFGHETEAGKERLKNDLPPLNLNQTVFQIAVEEVTDVMNEGFNSDASDKVYPLQKRFDFVTPIVGIGGVGGIIYMILNNLSNMEVVIKYTWGFVLKKCFNKGKKLKNGGCMSPDGKSIDWNGKILQFVHETVHVLCISPNVMQSITITISDNTVVHNGRLIVQNNKRNDELHEEPKYQKCDDGSFWYTNLKVGIKMNENEEKEFKDFQVLLLEEQKKLVKKVFVRYGDVPKKALTNLVRMNSLSPGESSRGRSSSPDGSSRGKLEKSNSMSFNFEDVDESGYDSVEVDALLDKTFAKPEDTDNAGTACGLFQDEGQIRDIRSLPSRRSLSRTMTPRSKAFFMGLLDRVRNRLSFPRETPARPKSASLVRAKSMQGQGGLSKKRNSPRDWVRTKSAAHDP